MQQTEKYLQYAAQLTAKIKEIFNEDDSNYIDPQELNEDENLTHFIHALANVMPTHIFNKLTQEKQSQINFNHMANILCFQYSKKD